MKLHAEPFEMIKSGIKTIELRLNDEKRQKLKFGDCCIALNEFQEAKALEIAE